MPATRAPSSERQGGAAKVQFGLFEADLATGELRKAGVRIRLQAQPFRVLSFLLERPGEVVTREEIQQRVWGNDTIVDHADPGHLATPPLASSLCGH